MGELHDVMQKVKGNLQKAKGELQQQTSSQNDLGTKVKGGISKIKGEFNTTSADMKLRSREKRSTLRKERAF